MRMRKTQKLVLFLLLASITPAVFGQTVAELRRGFENPPADSRIMMRWWWFGPSVTKTELERELRVMKEGGIGGVEVQPVYPLLPDDPKTGHRNIPYLSDEFLDLLKFTSQKAKQLGMRFDLTLGSGWSFGGAKTPITKAAGQLRVERVKVDAGMRQIPIPSMIPAEKLMAVFLSAKGGNTIAQSDLKELTDIRNDNVFLPAPGSAGSEVLFFIAGKSGMQVKRPSVGSEGYVLNHLDKPSVDNYLRLTGDRLFEKFGKDEVPYSVFCDSLEVYNQDWTDDFLAEFQKRRGYDLKPYLPALIADIGPTTGDVRYDWGRTITELFDERFMVPMQAWSRANGTRFRIQGYGIPAANISSNKWADISDGEGAQWKVVRAARWAASANHIYGRSVTSSETWTWLNSPVFRATPLDMKAEADIHFLQGINQLIGHGWGYTPPYVEYPGWRFYAAGAYSEQNPWWIVMPDLAAYFQRMSYILRQGTPQNDVALYLPTADAYAHFSAGRVHLIDADRDLVGEKVMPAIFEAGYNLDFFDDEVMRTVGKSERGVLSLGESRHRAVVLPGIERMPLETLRKLDEFVQSGGKIVVTRKLPTKVPGLQASAAQREEFASISNRLFKGGNASVKFVEKDEDAGTALRAMLEPDAVVAPSSPDVASVHRKVGDADLFFIANTSNRAMKIDVAFRATAEHAEVWDAVKAQAFAADVAGRTATATTVRLDLAPYGSRVVVFSKTPRSLTKEPAAASIDASVDLSADWSMTLGDQPARQLSTLGSWAEDGPGRHYSGTATYEKSFELASNFLRPDGKAILDLGEGTSLDVQPMRNGMRTWYDPPVREAAVIYVNSTRAGSLWCPPYRVDLSQYLKPGRNTIRIVVGNTALNYMAGRKLPDYKLLHLRYGERFQPQEMEKIQPLPSGLLGPVKIIAARK